MGVVAGVAAMATTALGLGLGASVTTAQTTASRFIAGPCPKPPSPIPELKTARCGQLIVPENRRHPNGRTISLSVVIISSRSPNPKPDPITWLAGGPGDDAITEIPWAVAGDLNSDRDVIFMSQRGTYTAQPFLPCRAVDLWAKRTLNQPYGARTTGRAFSVATKQCRRNLVKRGVDLSAYNTLESSDDLDDLRLALGIAKWNVYGISYGSDLALNYMRMHPQGIRSVGIDGIFAPHLAGGAGNWTSIGEGVNAVFRACQAQTRCRRRYGNIGATFRRLVIRYERHPQSVSVRVPGHKGRVRVMMSGGMLVQWAVSGAGTHMAARVPARIDALAHGNAGPIASTWAALKLSPAGVGIVSNGLFYGVSCGEWVPYETDKKVIASARRAFPSFPRSVLRSGDTLPFMRQNCRDWNIPSVDASVRDIVYSTIPTLVISAQYDAQTAPSFGPYVARTLPNSTVVKIPNVSHVAFSSPSPAANACTQSIARSFFDVLNSVDTSCARRVPPTRFVITRRR